MPLPEIRDGEPTGADKVGPVPAWMAYTGVMLLNLAGALLILTALVWLGDVIEDALFPGGIEWVDF